MASSINASTAGVGGVITTADNTGILNIQTAGTTAVTIDASQNVGVGTVSPRSKLESLSGSANTNADTAGTAGAFVGATGSGQSSIVSIESNDAIAANTGGVLAFGGRYLNTQYANWASIKGLKDTATSGEYGGYLSFFTRTNGASSAERMRIDASGNLLVGTTTAIGADGNTINVVGGMAAYTGATATTAIVGFHNPNGRVGYVATTGTTTSYVTSSDYRLKNTIAPMTGALEKVALLKPVTYSWKSDGSDGQGFIAHELGEIVPECVSGEKDATKEEEYEISPAIPAVLDEEGVEVTPAVEAVMGTRTVPVYQGIDTSFLVATLTAAIQEQQAMIDELKAEIDLLKGVK